LLKIARLPDDKAIQEGTSTISGVALLMLQAPLIKLVSDKQVYYGEGLESANTIILTMLEVEGMIKAVSTKETEIIFPSYLPADDKMQADINQVRTNTIMGIVNAGMLSKETAMKIMMDQGLIDIASVDDEMEAIAEEKTSDANSLFPDQYKNDNGDKGNDDDMMDDDNSGDRNIKE
jgi:hypothetical protein